MKQKLIYSCTLVFICLFQVIAEEKISLVDIKPMKAKVGFGGYYTITDGNTRSGGSDGTFNVNGQRAQKGLFTHAESELVFSIPTGVRKFVAVGTMPNFRPISREVDGFDTLLGSWDYEVLIDGIEVYQSEPLCAYLKKEVPIVIDIPDNAKTITLINHMLGNNNADHAIWGDPFFIKP